MPPLECLGRGIPSVDCDIDDGTGPPRKRPVTTKLGRAVGCGTVRKWNDRSIGGLGSAPACAST
jgi:hypothetical protein